MNTLRFFFDLSACQEQVSCYAGFLIRGYILPRSIVMLKDTTFDGDGSTTKQVLVDLDPDLGCWVDKVWHCFVLIELKSE